MMSRWSSASITLLISMLVPLASHAQALPPDQGEAILREVQKSHIDGNLPPEGDFHRLLQRDLVAYFTVAGQPVPTVEYQLLRDGPTQSGVSYPKYYVWVRVAAPGGPTRQGAARVAAIERQRFEVAQFLLEADIKSNPSQLEQVFPAPVAERIRANLRSGGP